MEFLKFLNDDTYRLLNNFKNINEKTYILYGREGSNHMKVALYFGKNLGFDDRDIIMMDSKELFIEKEKIDRLIEECKKNFDSKLFIINIDKLREDSWSPLLKSLEEPINISFILISKNNSIPKTILSRSLYIDISPSYEKVVDKDLYSLLNYNLEDYLQFQSEKLDLKDFKAFDLLDSCKSFSKNKGIKEKLNLILSIKEFFKNIKYLNKIDLILLSEKIESFISKEEIVFFVYTFTLENLKNNKSNIEKILFIKSCISKNISIKLILINLFLSAIEK